MKWMENVYRIFYTLFDFLSFRTMPIDDNNDIDDYNYTEYEFITLKTDTIKR
jgi:hypothetical protein